MAIDLSKYLGNNSITGEKLELGRMYRAGIINVREKIYDNGDERLITDLDQGKFLSLNITNARILAEAWGPPEAWVGEELLYWRGERTHEGKQKAAVFVKAIIRPRLPGQEERPAITDQGTNPPAPPARDDDENMVPEGVDEGDNPPPPERDDDADFDERK
jgi:hypothetical protein